MIVRNIVQLAYGVPCILSYLLVFYALVGLRRQLQDSFMFIMTVMSVTNIATWLNTWIFLKLSSEPIFFIYFTWLKENPMMIDIHTFLITHFYYAQNLDVLILTFDRFCAIYGRQRDMRWWSKHYIPIIIIAHIVLFGVQLFLEIPMTVVSGYDSSKAEFVFSPKPNEKETASGIFQISFGLIMMVACAGLSAYSQMILRNWKKMHPTIILQTSFSRITCCIVLTQFCNLAATMASRIGQMTNSLSTDQLYLLHEIMFVTSDMFSLLPPLYIIFVPGIIREHLAKMVLPG